jgi:hypothetical protein
MQKYGYKALVWMAVVALLAVAVPVYAMDMAEASSMMADIAAAQTQANDAWLAAVQSEDLDAAAAAEDKADAVKKAYEDAEAAYEALEAADGDDPAAEQALNEAYEDAMEAIGKEAPPQDAGDQPAGGDPDALPNIYDDLSTSDGLRKLEQSQYNISKSASAEGGSEFAESDATSI